MVRRIRGGRGVSRHPSVSKMELYIKYVNAFITDITKNSILDVVQRIS